MWESYRWDILAIVRSSRVMVFGMEMWFRGGIFLEVFGLLRKEISSSGMSEFMG